MLQLPPAAAGHLLLRAPKILTRSTLSITWQLDDICRVFKVPKSKAIAIAREVPEFLFPFFYIDGKIRLLAKALEVGTSMVATIMGAAASNQTHTQWCLCYLRHMTYQTLSAQLAADHKGSDHSRATTYLTILQYLYPFQAIGAACKSQCAVSVDSNDSNDSHVNRLARICICQAWNRACAATPARTYPAHLACVAATQLVLPS